PWLSLVIPHLPFYTPKQRLALVAIAADTHGGKETTEPGHDRLAAFTSLSLTDLSSAIGGLLLPRDRSPYSTPALRRVRRGTTGARTAYRLLLPDLEARHTLTVDDERPAAGLLCLLPRLDLTLSARLVLTMLTLLSVDGRTVEASNRHLAVLCGIGRDTVIAAMDQLCHDVPPGTDHHLPNRRPARHEVLADSAAQRPARYRLHPCVEYVGMARHITCRDARIRTPLGRSDRRPHARPDHLPDPLTECLSQTPAPPSRHRAPPRQRVAPA